MGGDTKQRRERRVIGRLYELIKGNAAKNPIVFELGPVGSFEKSRNRKE